MNININNVGLDIEEIMKANGLTKEIVNKRVVWEKIKNIDEMVIEKATLIPAMEQILNEYNNNTHTAYVMDCALCKLFKRVIDGGEDMDTISCTKCPMNVFEGIETSHLCLNRICEPLSCPIDFEEDAKKLTAVKEFYILAIAKVKEMSEEEIQLPFKFLIDIDNEIADKYNIIKGI
jgi:hypothetical protein